MTLLWIALGLIALIGVAAIVRVLARVLAAARQLQHNVDLLGQSVNAELERLEGDVADLGESIDKTRRR
ncbi:MAG TPA: hypothetical protein VHS52_08980 [Acidimicrobiales bacterium]|jgi:hypothetical protein|nr:hypothetical protein [Acidimicrobiales bacterium]